jgi:hypothetical protein
MRGGFGSYKFDYNNRSDRRASFKVHLEYKEFRDLQINRLGFA